jgi:hypothetical protein
MRIAGSATHQTTMSTNPERVCVLGWMTVADEGRRSDDDRQPS